MLSIAQPKSLSIMKVFVLGDSRTGTTSINSFLTSLGILSTHYYIKEANQLQPDHENREHNLKSLISYIDNSNFNGFTDYPTRLYFKELFRAYQDAYFILTVRKSKEVWIDSMESYFNKQGIDINKDEVIKNYETINQNILDYFKRVNGNFLIITIDESNNNNSEKIKKFLGIKSSLHIGHENKSVNNYLKDVTKLKILYSYKKEDWLNYLERACAPNKTLVSEKGWLYLINDGNDFFHWAYGQKTWTSQQLAFIKVLFEERLKRLNTLNAEYVKFVIPEKNIIYPEYLPHIFDNKSLNSDRPSKLMTKLSDNFFYLEKYLKSLKGFGRLYFKGDTHVSWLGAYYIYINMHEVITQKFNLMIGEPIRLDELETSIAEFSGDLYDQLSKIQLSDIHGVWGSFNFSNSLGYEIQYKYHQDEIYVKPPENYVKEFGKSRDVIITESTNKKLPRAVIFRDSTCTFIQPLLSKHFSRAVYVWHTGEVHANIIEQEKPDIVIHVMAERFISNYYDRFSIV